MGISRLNINFPLLNSRELGIEAQTFLTRKRLEKVLTVSNRLENQIFQSGKYVQVVLDTSYSTLFMLFLFC